jgi:hypothetical protein
MAGFFTILQARVQSGTVRSCNQMRRYHENVGKGSEPRVPVIGQVVERMQSCESAKFASALSRTWFPPYSGPRQPLASSHS